jgi:hypothetical protein
MPFGCMRAWVNYNSKTKAFVSTSSMLFVLAGYGGSTHETHKTWRLRERLRLNWNSSTPSLPLPQKERSCHCKRGLLQEVCMYMQGDDALKSNSNQSSWLSLPPWRISERLLIVDWVWKRYAQSCRPLCEIFVQICWRLYGKASVLFNAAEIIRGLTDNLWQWLVSRPPAWQT